MTGTSSHGRNRSVHIHAVFFLSRKILAVRNLDELLVTYSSLEAFLTVAINYALFVGVIVPVCFFLCLVTF